MRALKIATFNINGIRSRLPALLAWLEREQPDIACLQELKAADQQFPRQAIEAAGYGCLYQGQPSWNGVAILARVRPYRSMVSALTPSSRFLALGE
ncbi:Exodeoxyribonuclease III [Pseudomonas sp. IsoF]|nr:Exodeoxyribonuclease III [Pseudomonas sp. IsoF]